MMKSFWFFIFFSVLLIGKPESSVASDSFNIQAFTSALELKPASISGTYKTAAVCFMGFGDCDSDMDYSIDTADQCKNEGFTLQNCSAVQEPTGVCSYNSNYGKGCKCKTGLVSCTGGQVGVGDSCGGQYASCQCLSGVPSGSYGCKTYYDYPCNSVCKVANTDNCHLRSSVSTPYGCQSYWADCTSKCEVAKGNSDCDVASMSCDYGCSTTNSCSKCTACKGNSDCDVASMSCDYGCSTTNSCSKCTACKGNPDCDVTDQSCDNGCASTNSCSKCTACKGNPDCDVASMSCDYGCSTTNSCSKCTACKGNSDCDVASMSCDYGCSTTNSCSKCTACKGNPDCDVTAQTCPYGCASTNSCSKCTSCAGNPCDAVTAVSVPANATCSTNHATCSSKCSAWACKGGYTNVGGWCQTNTVEIHVYEDTNGMCPGGPYSTISFEKPDGIKGTFPRHVCSNNNSSNTKMSLPVFSKISIQVYSNSSVNSFCKITKSSPSAGNEASISESYRTYSYTIGADTSPRYIIWNQQGNCP